MKTEKHLYFSTLGLLADQKLNFNLNVIKTPCITYFVCVYQRGNKYYTKVHALSVLAFFKKDGFSILTPFLGHVHCCVCNVCTAPSESEGKPLLHLVLGSCGFQWCGFHLCAFLKNSQNIQLMRFSLHSYTHAFLITNDLSAGDLATADFCQT